MRLSRNLVHAALAGLALTFAAPACSDDPSPDPTPKTEVEKEPTIDQAELRMAVRALFEDRVAWTRVYLVETVADLPGKQAAAARLIANGDALGEAIVPFYGQEAGDALAGMLNAAVGHAAAAVDAALVGDMDGFAAAREAWYGEADAVASFLAGANDAWNEAEVAALLHGCIDDAVAEATASMGDDMAGGLAAFEAHQIKARAIADALAAGIASQFADDIGEVEVTAHQAELRVAMRDLFFERATFVRMFLLDAIEELPSYEASVGRLLQNDADIGDAVRPFYGDEAADALRSLLDAGLEDAAAAVAAAKAGDMQGFEDAKQRWLDHADETAVFLAGANPAWPEADLKALLRTCVEDAIGEASARLGGDYTADGGLLLAAGARVQVVAAALGAGVAAQFPAEK
ncbi:MAG: hypothetical protein KC731_14105 [Myxococcales bacterium]|nr:hypothetical protein [Myxococcales bacterium]